MLDKYDVVQTTVTIAGQVRHFVDLHLFQSFNSHHEFRIVLNYEAFGQKWMSNPKEIVTLVGEEVVISMFHTLSGTENLFIGLVTNAVISGKNGIDNNVVLVGKGQTARLDGKKAMDSFMNKTLEGVVTEAVANSGNGARLKIEPVHQEKIDYICQYNESDFEFLNRLSYIYGEWFWDTGREIRFGKGTDSNDSPLRLMYDMNMIDFELSANLVPARFNRYGYLVHLDKEVKSYAMDDVENVRGYQKMVLNKSDMIYSTEGDLPVDAPVTGKQELDMMVELERSRAAAQMLTISGSSRTCQIQLGKKVQILLPASVPMRDVDEFMVTYIEHHVNEIGKYKNSFRGIVSDMQAVPMEAVDPPRTGAQQATVLSNADPENKGRVQVQLQWQKGLGKSTNWIRVQTPDAGSSGKVKSNRGFVCIPEEGDSVMVGFDYGDPNRPYVMGSVFSELTGAGGGAGNKGKSIVSRSGNALKLDDEKGSVVLQDKGGASMSFDGAGNVNTQANTSFNSTVGKSASVLKMDSDGIIDLSGHKSISLKVGDNTITIDGESNTITVKSENINIEGTTNTLIGENNTITGKSNTKINGASANIETSDQLLFKGKPTILN